VGLALILVPLYTVGEIRGGSSGRLPEAFSNNFKEVEGSPPNTPRFSESDVTVFAVSFVVALASYVLIRHKMPDHDYSPTARFPF
jgi:hypothetical protein